MSTTQADRGTQMITKNNVTRIVFDYYTKVGQTRISRQVFPAGTVIETATGPHTCNEPSRIGIDTAGLPYPIAEPIFATSYASTGDSEQEQRQTLVAEELAQWKRYSSYLLSCCRCGEHDAQTFDEFAKYVAEAERSSAIAKAEGRS